MGSEHRGDGKTIEKIIKEKKKEREENGSNERENRGKLKEN